MSIRQRFCNTAVSLLPSTRAFRLKAWLFRQAGMQISTSARIISTVKIWGTISLSVGDDCFIGHEVLIGGGDSQITIGKHVDIAPRVSILSGTHEVDMVGKHSAGAGYSQDITIEDGVWIGAGSTILAGVTIGRKAIIAAGSTVTQDIPAYTLAAGTPCRPKKTWSVDAQGWLGQSEAEAA